MFAFRIRYLTETVVSADYATGYDKTLVEWPPHPDRLFSALVQAWGDLGEPEDGRRVLELLEKLPPPRVRSLRLGEGYSRTNVTRFVPANDEKSPLCRTRNSRHIPSAWVGFDPVDFVWPEADLGCHRSILERLAAAVASLGHPSSMVAVECCQGDHVGFSSQNSFQELVPDPYGSTRLRVPHKGRLAYLTAQYHASPRKRPVSANWITYSENNLVQKPCLGLFGDMVVFRLRGSGRLPLASTQQIIQAFRRTLMGYAKQPVSDVISGHAPDSTPEQPLPSQRPHLALSPLPDVGHMHASGNLLGIAAIIPRELNQQEQRECLRSLGAIGSSLLVVGRLGIWTLERQNMETDLQALLPETWSRVSSIWATVTPFVFGRYPNSPYGSEAVDIICESCRMTGLPEPDQVEIGPVSVVLGVPRASDFPSLATSTAKPRKYHVHVRLRFAQPIQGPILIGWGRYLGYGLCRPMKEEP